MCLVNYGLINFGIMYKVGYIIGSLLVIQSADPPSTSNGHFWSEYRTMTELQLLKNRLHLPSIKNNGLTLSIFFPVYDSDIEWMCTRYKFLSVNGTLRMGTLVHFSQQTLRIVTVN